MKTKINKKLLSLILAVSMTLTSFAGLTLTTASAEAPAFDEWTLGGAEYTAPTDTASDISGLNDADGTDWQKAWKFYTTGDTVRTSNTSSYVWMRTSDKTLAVQNGGYAVYTKVPSSGEVYYYTYTIKPWAAANNLTVSLEGAGDTIISADNLTAKAEYTFTTVIDAANNKAYTYNTSGSALGYPKETSLSSAVTGIKFESKHSDSALWVTAFSSGTVKTPPNLSTFRLTAVDNDSSEKFTKTLDELKAGNWKEYKNADGSEVSSGSRVQSNVLEVKWNRNVTYTPSSSAEGMIYYKYTVLRDNVNNGSETPESFIHLAKTGSTKTDTDYEALSIKEGGDLALGTEGTFITVVDSENKKAYTYKSDNLTTPIKTVTIDTVTGIRFGNVDNYSAGMCMHIKSFEYGTVEALPEAPDYATLKDKFNQSYDLDTDTTANKSTLLASEALTLGGWTASKTSLKSVLETKTNVSDGYISFIYERKMTYSPTFGQDDDLYYFTYDIQMWNKNAGYQNVQLIGSTEHILFENPSNDTTRRKYTTVVDTAEGLAYTYEITGNDTDPAGIVTDLSGDTITGIRFNNTDLNNPSDQRAEFRIYSFVYGTIKEATETINISIDYEKAQLTGFDKDASYTVKVGEADAANIDTINENGTVDILDAWYGKTLTFTKGEVTADVTLTAQPEAPAATEYAVTNETGETKNGAVARSAEATKNLEYYDDTEKAWKTLDTTGVTDLEKGDTVKIRIKGVAEVKDGDNVTTEGAFPSAAATATVGRISGVTLDTDGGEYANENDAFTTYIEGTEKALPTGLTKTGYQFAGWYETSDQDKTVVSAIPTSATGALSYTAKWTPNNNTITNNAADDKEGNTTKNGYVTVAANADYKATVTITLNPNTTAEYILDSLTVTGTDEISTTKVSDTSYTFEMPNEAVTVDATFKEKTYTVVAAAGENVTKVTLTRQSDNKSQTVTVSENKAAFELPKGTYNVSAEFETGYVLDSATSDATYVITADAASNAFKVNAKQATDPAIEGSVSITGTPTVGQTLTAVPSITNAGDGTVSYQWKAKGTDDAEYQNIGTNADTYVLTANEAGKTIIVVVTKEGTSGSLTSDPTNAVAPKTYTVKGTVGAGVASVKLKKGSDEPIEGNVSAGVITFSGVLEGTYTVVVEKESSYKSASSDPETITVNDANAADYAAKAFEATAVAYANPTVTIEGGDAAKGTVTVTGGAEALTNTGSTTAQETTTIKAAAEAKTGYTVVLKYKYDGDAEFTNVPENGEITVGTKAITIQAVFTTNTHAVTKTTEHGSFTVTGTGVSDLALTAVPYGTELTVEATPATGYELAAENPIVVTKADDENTKVVVSGGKFTMPDYDVTVTVTFTQKNYTVTDETGQNANGSLTIDKTTNVHYNDSVKITIEPAQDYELDTLTVGGEAVPAASITNNEYTFQMPDNNVTVSATFKAVQVDPTKKLTYWTEDGSKTLNAAESYPIDFGESNNNTADTALGNQWSLALVPNKIRIRNGSNSNSNIVLAIEGGENYNETLNEAANDGVFYYKYTIQSFKGGNDDTGSHNVELAGTTGGILFSSPASAVSGLRTYTTVVDADNNKAYTYGADGNLIGSAVEYTGTVTGISFINTQASGAFWIDDIEYGTIGIKPVPKVTISAVDSAEGSVTVMVDSEPIATNTEVATGTSVTVTIAAQDGYEIDTFTVGGEDKKSALNEGVYTFEMPDKDVAIAVTFKHSATEPDPEGPAFSSWGITDYTVTGDYQEFYEDHFKNYNGYIGNMARADKVTNPLPKAYWTVLAGKDGTDVLLRDAIGSDSTGFMQVKHAANGTASGSVKYTNDVESDKYYYQYDLRIGKGEIEVKLDGITDNVIIDAKDGDVTMATYTTIVDTESKKVYTYKGDTLIKTNEIGTGEVTGIIFSHVTSNNADVADKGYADIDRFGHYYVKKAVDPTAKPKVKITAYDSEQGTVTVSAGETSITSGNAEIDAQTSVTVTVAAKDGYEIDTFTVGGEDKKSALNEGVYTFEMPDEDVAVAVTFKQTGGSDEPQPGSNPKLSEWTLGKVLKNEDFAYEKKFDSFTDSDENWSYTYPEGSTQADTVYLRDETTLQVRHEGEISYNYEPVSDISVYYYKYYVQIPRRAVKVTLKGAADNEIISSDTTVGDYTWFTTVVDTENGKVYTYSGTDEEPVSVNEIADGEKVTGISFKSTDQSGWLLMDKFRYGVKDGETDPNYPEPEEPEPTEEPEKPAGAESKLSDWDLTNPTETENFDGKSITTLQNGNWKFGNTTGSNFNEKHVIINGSNELEVNWYGTATYAVTDEDNSYYYTYTVKTKDQTGIRSVNLSGVDNSTMLVSGSEITSAETTFTTVVDINSKKAYTYNTATGDFVSEVDVPSPEDVKGITFSGGMVNVSAGMQIDNVSFGLVNIAPPETPVTIVLKSDDVNDGKQLENGNTYEVTGEKFVETVISFDKPYTSKDGKALLYMTNTLTITSPNENIVVDGTKITALEALTAGEYNIEIDVKSEYKGEEYGSENYIVKFVKPEVTDDEILNEYEPVITTETVDGKEITVSTDTGAAPTEVYDDLTLPTETSFANITWNSDKDDILSDNGEIVKRPLEDTVVVLTATIANKYNAGTTVKKQVSVLVKGVGAMLDDALENALKILSADSGEDVDLTNLHEDIMIYTDYKSDTYPEDGEVKIEWTSSDDVLKINGGTAEIYPTSTNTYNVKLTVKVSALGAEKSKDVNVTVHLTEDNAAPKYAVRCDDLVEENFAEVAALEGTTVSSNITVPTKGLFGSNISWTSSVPNYISNTGKYTVPSSNTSAKLTAVVSRGTVMSDKTHTYSFTVKGKNSSSSGGGGGGGGSSSGRSSSSSYSLPINASPTPVTSEKPSDTGSTDTETSEPQGFTDLGSVAWAEEAINALAQKGIISGRDEHTFDPNANITRAEFATIIVKAFGFEDADATVSVFDDVSEDDWYYSFVAAAYNNGIISGYDNGSFGSSDNITRQDMAVIIYRAATAAGTELAEVNEGKVFDDEASISDYAKDAVDALVRAGVINGMTDTEFAPAANATRAQAAKMTYELVK